MTFGWIQSVMLRRPALGAAVAAALGAIATAGTSSSVLNDYTGAAPDPPKSSWVYPELLEGIALRRKKERELREYVSRKGPALAALNADRVKRCRAASSSSGCEAAQRKYTDLVRRLERETAELTWGSVEAQARRSRFTRDYGCTAWTDEAIAELKGHAPLVEVGAGNGQWAAALRRAGASIVAYDDFSALPLPRKPAENQGVLRGNESVLSGWRLHLRPRTLLVVYPEGDLLLRCLSRYRGEVLLFVGEGRGGVNATEETFDLLERDWVVERTVQVRPFDGGYEKLWVCRRRRPP